MAAKTILICDDEPVMRELLKVVLDDGFEIAEAGDGAQALALARKLEPDLLLLDVMMPGRSGIEVLGELRSDPRLATTPVIVVSAWDQLEAAALEAGANSFFLKPFDPDALRSAVEELLS